MFSSAYRAETRANKLLLQDYFISQGFSLLMYYAKLLLVKCLSQSTLLVTTKLRIELLRAFREKTA